MSIDVFTETMMSIDAKPPNSISFRCGIFGFCLKRKYFVKVNIDGSVRKKYTN